MITGISIENFKGIRERVEVQLRPITLLFGVNSAGKSTVLQALLFAHEVLKRRNLNPDKTACGGTAVDLGGFLNLVHGHERVRDIRVSLTLNVNASDLESLTFRGPLDSDTSVDDFCREFSEIELQFVVSWPETSETPLVSQYEISIDGEWFASLSREPGRPETLLEFDSQHSVLLRGTEFPVGQHPFDSYPSEPEDLEPNETLLGALWEWLIENEWIEGAIPSQTQSDSDNRCKRVYVDQRLDALPDPESVLPLRTAKGMANEEDGTADVDDFAVDSVVATLSRLIVGPAQLATTSLTSFRYLGPLRETPSRDYSPPNYPEGSRWASGLGAWDALHHATDEFVDQVGDWLGGEANLNAGCRIERRSYLELDLANDLLRKLISGRAFDEVDEDANIDVSGAPMATRIVVIPSDTDIELRPHDVGVGISQIVPVIVTALDGKHRLLAIEQPELHIHPRLQAELADLFVEANSDNGHRFLIETHSEHLILRLLRRIRETEEGKAELNRELRTDDLAVYYIKQEDGRSQVSRIDVDVKGEFVQPWPDDFFEIDFYERFS